MLRRLLRTGATSFIEMLIAGTGMYLTYNASRANFVLSDIVGDLYNELGYIAVEMG